MEGAAVAAVGAMPPANNGYTLDDDLISFDSDSSGDSKLRRSLERKFMTPHQRLPSDHRDGVPADSPQRRNSKGRQRPRSSSYQEGCSPVPYSWYYNPYSQRDYSPSVASVGPRKSISTWMDAMMRTPSDQNFRKRPNKNDDDDSSIDSVEQLEQAAMQIRSEIRQLEMKELADEAESAAEAGLESFAGRASTFGDSTHSLDYVDLNNVNPKQQYKLRRYSTYAEGTSLLRQAVRPMPRPKIRCLQLRDISEVIPPIGELHLHLKTHLELAGIEQQPSMEPAVTENDERDGKRSKTPVEFLTSLKSWVSKSPSRGSDAQSPNTDVASNVTTPRQSTVSRSNKLLLDSLQVNTDDDDDDGECSVSSFTSMGSYEVGGRLSGHLHAPRAVRRSPIRIPSGLDLPEDLGIPHEVPVKLLLNDVDRTDGDTVETVPTSSSSQQGDSNQDNTERTPPHDLEDLPPPIELFPLGDDEDSDSIEDDASPMETDLGAPNVFLTPMRLRGIRKASRRLTSKGTVPNNETTDYEWAVAAVRPSKSEPRGPAEEDHSLSIPLLTTKSDGADCSPIAPLNRSEDVNMSYLSREESMGNELPSLERPKSLSFDEHDVVGVVEQKMLPEPSAEYDEDLNFVDDDAIGAFADEKLNDVRTAVQSMPSRDLSLVVAPSDEIQFSTEPVGSKEALDTGNGISMDEGNVNRESSRMSFCSDMNLPLMPTLEKIDEPKHADESNAIDISTENDLDLSMLTAQVIVPKIEKRPCICAETDRLTTPAIETDNDSLQSLELEEVFSATELCSTEAADRGTQHSQSLTEIAYRVRREAAEATENAMKSPPRDFNAETNEVPSEGAGLLEDELVEVASALSSSDSESKMDRPDDEAEMEVSQAAFTEEHSMVPTDGPPEQVSIEVDDLNGSSTSIGNHYRAAHQGHSPGRRQNREIVRSPSGRVRVTIEQPCLTDGLDESDCSDDDDDDVRSEADSVRTPQPRDCECLINAATQLESSVGVDLAKAGECALARYDLSFIDNRDEKNTSIVSAPCHLPAPPESPSKEVCRQPSISRAANMSSLRRSLSCPSFVDKEVDESMDSIPVIPHKGSEPRAGVNSASDRALRTGHREYFRTSSMMDPCQSTSPFRETMDDMMKSFSPKRSLESEMKLLVRAEENHDFLSNYLYCSKPPEEPSLDIQQEPEVACNEHCDYFSGVLDAYRSIVPKRATSGKDMLSLNAHDESYAASAEPETWFDVASEHFDGALETFMGRAQAQGKRWNSMFQAPGLKSKKENGKSPRKKGVQGIVLVKQQSTTSHGSELTDQQFAMMYGVTREEFARLPVTERSALHDVVSERRKRWSTRSNSKLTMGSVEPPSPAMSARSLSSSNLVGMEEHVKI